MKLIPAIKFKDTGETLAIQGYSHPGLWMEAVDIGLMAQTQIGKEVHFSREFEDGFVDPDENFLDRESALNWVIKKEKLNKKQVEKIVEYNGFYGLESVAYEECFD